MKGLSVIQQRSEHGIVPAYLHADDIAELWAEGTEFSREAYQRLIREEIEDRKLTCMTVGQLVEAVEEKQKELPKRTRPPKIMPPQKGNAISVGIDQTACSMCGIGSSDTVPEDRVGGYLGDTSGMSVHEKEMATRLYMVNRTEFKKWLQENDEWPLPEECLLARWWDSDEGDECNRPSLL